MKKSLIAPAGPLEPRTTPKAWVIPRARTTPKRTLVTLFTPNPPTRHAYSPRLVAVPTRRTKPTRRTEPTRRLLDFCSFFFFQ